MDWLLSTCRLDHDNHPFVKEQLPTSYVCRCSLQPDELVRVSSIFEVVLQLFNEGAVSSLCLWRRGGSWRPYGAPWRSADAPQASTVFGTDYIEHIMVFDRGGKIPNGAKKLMEKWNVILYLSFSLFIWYNQARNNIIVNIKPVRHYFRSSMELMFISADKNGHTDFLLCQKINAAKKQSEGR